MRPGSVIVDLAAETGGNCELTEPGEVVNGARRDRSSGTLNLPSTMPLHASQMYARNIQRVLDHLITDGELQLDFDDEITADAIITHDGKVTTRTALRGSAHERKPVDRDHRVRAGGLRRHRGDQPRPHHPAHPAHVAAPTPSTGS